MLMMILGRQLVVLRDADLIATPGAAIDTGIGGVVPRRKQRIECLVLRLSQILTMFVESQGGLLSK